MQVQQQSKPAHLSQNKAVKSQVKTGFNNPFVDYGQGLANPFLASTPQIQCDFANELPNPDAEPVELTPAQIRQAIEYNRTRLHNAREIMMLRDVLGISHDAPTIDEELIMAIVRWQAGNNVTQDGKLGPDTITPLVSELSAEGLRTESSRMDIRTQPSTWRRNFDSKFDAELDHRNARLDLHVKVRFNFRPAGSYPDFDGTMVASPGWTAAEQASWQSRYISLVQNRWSNRYGLIPRGTRSERFLDFYNVRVLIEPVASGEHHTLSLVNVAAGTF
jgi:hypothetical protein